MGLGKKQGILISKAWKNMTGQSHPVPYTGRSKNSAKIMQDLYDGVYISMPTGKPEVSNSDYLAIETLYGTKEDEVKKGIANRGIFQIIVLRHIDCFSNETNKAVRKIGVEKILNDSYVNPPRFLFNPSYHAITDDKNNPSSWAIDLRTSDSSKLLKEKHNQERDRILEETKHLKPPRNIGRAYDGGEEGEPHIHVTYIPLLKPPIK